MAGCCSDEQLDGMQQSLSDWKHIIVVVDQWLRWDQDSYPCIMCAAITAFYVFLWMIQPPVLTTVALVVMVVCLLDYLVPSVFKEYFSKQTWTEFKQERYEKCCSQLIKIKQSVDSIMGWVVDLRQNKPKYYFFSASVTLLTVAFVGKAIPGLLLAYILTVFLVLLPGLVYHGFMARLYARLLQTFINAIKKHRKKD